MSLKSKAFRLKALNRLAPHVGVRAYQGRPRRPPAHTRHCAAHAHTRSITPPTRAQLPSASTAQIPCSSDEHCAEHDHPPLRRTRAASTMVVLRMKCVVWGAPSTGKSAICQVRSKRGRRACMHTCGVVALPDRVRLGVGGRRRKGSVCVCVMQGFVQQYT